MFKVWRGLGGVDTENHGTTRRSGVAIKVWELGGVAIKV